MINNMKNTGLRVSVNFFSIVLDPTDTNDI